MFVGVVTVLADCLSPQKVVLNLGASQTVCANAVLGLLACHTTSYAVLTYLLSSQAG